MHFGASEWAKAFKQMFADKRFLIDFMYGAVDGTAVRVVFGLRHLSNPKISPHGVGALLQKLFAHKDRKGFSPVLAVDETTLVVVLAHIARYRNTTDPAKDMFNPYDSSVGDVGNELAATVVEWVRYTSCRLMLDGLQRDLDTVDSSALRTKVMHWNKDTSKLHGIPFQYNIENPKVWNSKDKMAKSASVIFQVWRC